MANKDVREIAIKDVHFFMINIQKKQRTTDSVKYGFPVFQSVAITG